MIVQAAVYSQSTDFDIYTNGSSERLAYSEENRIKNAALDLFFIYVNQKNLDNFNSEIYDDKALLINECILHPNYRQPIEVENYVKTFSIYPDAINSLTHKHRFEVNELPQSIDIKSYAIEKSYTTDETSEINGTLELSYLKVIESVYELPKSTGFELDLPKFSDTLHLKMIIEFNLRLENLNNGSHNVLFGNNIKDFKIKSIASLDSNYFVKDIHFVEGNLTQVNSDKLQLQHLVNKLNSDYHIYIHKYLKSHSVVNESIWNDYDKTPLFSFSDIEGINYPAIINNNIKFDGGQDSLKFPHLVKHSVGTISPWRAQFGFKTQIGNGIGYKGWAPMRMQHLSYRLIRRGSNSKSISKKIIKEINFGIGVSDILLAAGPFQNEYSGNSTDYFGENYIRVVSFNDVKYSIRAQVPELSFGISWLKLLSKGKTQNPIFVGLDINASYGISMKPLSVTGSSYMNIAGRYPQYFNVVINTNGIEDFGNFNTKGTYQFQNNLQIQSSEIQLLMRKWFNGKKNSWALSLNFGLRQNFIFGDFQLEDFNINSVENNLPILQEISNSNFLQKIGNICIIKKI